MLLFLVASTVALFIQLLPGDPARLVVGETASQEQVDQARRNLGLDRPVWEQYVSWLSGTAKGDLGESLISGRSIAKELLTRLPRTFELIGASIFLAILLGIPAGVIAASYHNRFPDIGVSLVSLIGISTPVFVTGPLLLLVFTVELGVIRTGYVSFAEDPRGHLMRLLLPALVLGIREAAVIMRMVRSSLLEVLNEDYVRTATAKGLSRSVVLYRHALRNALVPVIAVLGLQTGHLLAGTVLVEYIFNWPGISSFLFTAIGQRDYPAVQGVMLVTATLFILLNLLTDVVYVFVDPRIKYG